MAERTHHLFMGADWGRRAQSNVEKWGNQSTLTLFLAAIEEMGEVAIELSDQDADGDHPPGTPEAQARALVDDMATLGRETRHFLESTFEEPAGEPKPGADREDIRDDIDILVDDPDAVQTEVDDLAPLAFQMTWALESAGDGDA